MDRDVAAKPLEVVIVGAGIGGLVCAIACRRHGLLVKVLEQAAEILPVGAGIQIPPNASKILDTLGILPSVRKTANEIQHIIMRRYANGNVLAARPICHRTPWFVIHRADYYEVLLSEAKQLGAKIMLHTKVREISPEIGQVQLDDGGYITGDVIVGADGLWSTTRSMILGKTSEPTETGDLAYRGTFTLEQLEQLNDPAIEELCKTPSMTLWIGPDKHAVFYPVRAATQFNLVLLRPDDLPSGTRSVEGDIDEMRYTFKDWDPMLTKMISCIPSVLKWKLMHHDELDQWSKGCAVLLGDACHPTLPYQAQGAAMAVEDGAIIGQFLGTLNRRLVDGDIPSSSKLDSISAVLQLYETYQKSRTTQNVQGATSNRAFYHMRDGPEQEQRDIELAKHTFTNEKSKYKWSDVEYNKQLLDVDVLANSRVVLDKWLENATKLPTVTKVQ